MLIIFSDEQLGRLGDDVLATQVSKAAVGWPLKELEDSYLDRDTDSDDEDEDVGMDVAPAPL